MKINTKYHLKGSSLIEVLTGFSVLSLVFMIGIKGFSLVSGPLSPTYQFRTRLLIREMMYETIITHNTNDDKKEIQGRLLTKDIIPICSDGDLFQITITCFRGKTPLAKRYFITTLRQFNYENDAKSHRSGIYPPGNDGGHVSYGYDGYFR